MKKNYLEPEFELLKFEIINDLLHVSGETPGEDGDGEAGEDW